MKKFALFSERLKASRKKRDWTQLELAERSGVSKRSIVAWEKGEGTEPLVGNVVKLANALGVRMSWLWEGSEGGKYPAPKRDETGALQERGPQDYRGAGHIYLDRVMDECGPNRERQAWTYVQLKRSLPLGTWSSCGPEELGDEMLADEIGGIEYKPGAEGAGGGGGAPGARIPPKKKHGGVGGLTGF